MLPLTSTGSPLTMITAFRRYLETWPVRIFFGLMVISFVVWGVGDVVRMIGHPTWLAKVGGKMIEVQQFQPEFQRALAQAQSKLPPGQDMSADGRRQIADQTLQQMIGQVAMTAEETRLGIVVPDAAIRQAVFAMPAFHDKSGQFDRNLLDAVLRANSVTEGEFLSMVRGDLARAQVLDTVAGGAVPPSALVHTIFAAETERRSAQMLELPIAAAPAPPAPTDAELRRWYANHPNAFRIPEYRRIRAIILSPETIQKSMTVSDTDLRTWYDAHKAQFAQPATRSIEVAIIPDQAKAQALATAWRGGMNWDAVQKQAQGDGGSAVSLDKTTAPEIPDADLAKAAFAASQGQIIGPIKASLGWAVLDVTAIAAAQSQGFDQVKEDVRKRVLAERAAAELYDRANKVDDILGTGAGLDHLPADLGLAGVSGTLDAQGNTADGQPAPIPGPEELHKAVVAAAFERQPGPPSQLTEVQTPSTGGSAFYAVEVEQVMPATERPFDQVKADVAAQWTGAARAREQEAAAAAILTAVKGGESLADAAAKAGLTVLTTPAVTRDGTAEGMPPQLQHVLFGLKPGEPTMVETAESFVVAVPDKIEVPDPKTEPAQYDAVKDVLTRSTSASIAQIFTEAMRDRASPRINQSIFDSFVQQ